MRAVQSVRKGKIGDIKTASSLPTIPIRPELLRQLKDWRLACPKAQHYPMDSTCRLSWCFPTLLVDSSARTTCCAAIFIRHYGERGFARSGSTTCGTRAHPCCSLPVSASRTCRRSSGTPRPRSRSMFTATLCLTPRRQVNAAESSKQYLRLVLPMREPPTPLRPRARLTARHPP